LGGVRKIGDQVDASLGQQLHAGGVVGRGIDSVGTNHVGAELLHNRDITGTRSGIGQRVGVAVAIGSFCEMLVENLVDAYRGPTLIGNTTEIAIIPVSMAVGSKCPVVTYNWVLLLE
jgi:hypothetical protein